MADILARAPDRPAGYVEEIVSRGTIQGDKLVMQLEDWESLRLKYGSRCQSCGQ